MASVLFSLAVPYVFCNAVIEGPSVSSVVGAKRRVEIVSWTNRNKEKPTHFISIPVNLPHIMREFESFRELVISVCGKVRDIIPKLFAVLHTVASLATYTASVMKSVGLYGYVTLCLHYCDGINIGYAMKPRGLRDFRGPRKPNMDTRARSARVGSALIVTC